MGFHHVEGFFRILAASLNVGPGNGIETGWRKR